MSDKVGVDNLAAKILESVKEYTDGVEQGVAQVVEDTATECKTEIQTDSPERTGGYKKGWTIYRENRQGVSRRVIWNRRFYRLVHLLERGHASRSGGRVKAYPHVQPAEQKYTALLLRRIEAVIRKGRK